MTGFYQGSQAARSVDLLASIPLVGEHGPIGARTGPRRPEGVLHRRHALRGTRLPLLRPGRRPRPADAAQLAARPQGPEGAGPAARPHRTRGTASRRRARTRSRTTRRRSSRRSARTGTIVSLKKGGVEGVHRRRQRRHPRGDGGRPEGRGHDRGHVPGQQAGEGPRRTSPTASSTSASARSHAVAFAAGHGQGRAAADRGHLLARSCSGRFDQIFQEVALQNLPVVFALDRAGLTGPGRPDASRRLRHRLHAAVPEHGRAWPPATSWTCAPMLRLRPGPRRPDRRCATRRRTWRRSSATPAADRAGPGRGASSGARTACFVAFGTLFPTCVAGGGEAARARGCDVGVINARFVKPLDRRRSCGRSRQLPLVVTVEEGTLEGGFGSRRCWRPRTRPGSTRGNVVRLRHPGPLRRARRARRTARRLRSDSGETGGCGAQSPCD